MALRYLEEVVTLEFDVAKCTGCQMCVTVCPHGVFAMEGNRAAVVDRGACMECGACQRNCAFGAIEVQSGVGCASAIIASWFRRGPLAESEPTCGSSGGCC